MKCKLNNWEQLEKFCVRNEIRLDRTLITEVIHNKPGAGLNILEFLYTTLTKKPFVKELN